MRWDQLFRDLEAQLEAAQAADLDAEVADRTRREAALLGLRDRARGALGHRVAVRVAGSGVVDGVLHDVGSEWLLLAEEGGREALVPIAAVLSVGGLSAWTEVLGSGAAVARRLGLGSALRGVARDRSGVALTLVDGSVVSGTVDRVGADFLEVGVHDQGEPRRREAVRSVHTVPFAALAVLRSGY